MVLVDSAGGTEANAVAPTVATTTALSALDEVVTIARRRTVVIRSIVVARASRRGWGRWRRSFGRREAYGAKRRAAIPDDPGREEA